MSDQTDEKKGDPVIRSQRYFGKLERSFSLPLKPKARAEEIAIH